jgi:hypothetical protein
MLKDAKRCQKFSTRKNPRTSPDLGKEHGKSNGKHIIFSHEVLGAFAEVEDGCVFMETVMHVASRDCGLGGCWMIWRYWMICWMI